MSTRTMVTAVSLLTLLGSGCAKTPATTSGMSVPPPTNVTTAGPATRSVSPVSSRSDLTSQATTTPSSTARPRVSDFAPNAEVRDIFFDFDKYALRPDAEKILDANAGWLKSRANVLLLIEGHCDERGTTEYNLALGERRAKTAMNYLVSRGVDARRISIVSYGEDRPQCQEHNEACWAKNRRSHFLVKPR